MNICPHCKGKVSKFCFTDGVFVGLLFGIILSIVVVLYFGKVSGNVSGSANDTKSSLSVNTPTASPVALQSISTLHNGVQQRYHIPVATIPVSDSSTEMVTMGKILESLIWIESKGITSSIGDNGRAYGVLQIHPSVVEDVNNYYSFQFTHHDCFCPSISRVIAIHYLRHYGAVYEQQTGKIPTAEVYSRIWNGGPKGYTKSSTIQYSTKFLKEITQ